MMGKQTTALAPRQENALIGNIEGLKGLLGKDSFIKALADILPRHITPERMAKFAIVAANKNPLLQKCTRYSVMQAIMDSATYGLDCSGLGGRGHLIPYWSTKKGCYEAQFIPGYRGLMDVARRSNMVDAIWGNVVYEGEEFTIEEGTGHSLHHVPNYDIDRSDGKIKGAYACGKIKASAVVEFRYMSRKELEAVKQRALAKIKNKEASPWMTDFAAMCRKTPIRRLCGDLPQSAEMLNLMEHDNKVDAVLDIEPLAVKVKEKADDLVDQLTGEVQGPAAEDQDHGEPQDSAEPDALTEADAPEQAPAEQQPEPPAATRDESPAVDTPRKAKPQTVWGKVARKFDPQVCTEARCGNVKTLDDGTMTTHAPCAKWDVCKREGK